MLCYRKISYGTWDNMGGINLMYSIDLVHNINILDFSAIPWQYIYMILYDMMH